MMDWDTFGCSGSRMVAEKGAYPDLPVLKSFPLIKSPAENLPEATQDIQDQEFPSVSEDEARKYHILVGLVQCVWHPAWHLLSLSDVGNQGSSNCQPDCEEIAVSVAGTA
jgi:hypothetical protein